MISISDGLLKFKSVSLQIPSFQIDEGKTYQLIGESGSGKSLFLKSLCGQFPHTNYSFNHQDTLLCPAALNIPGFSFKQFVHEVNSFKKFSSRDLINDFSNYAKERFSLSFLDKLWEHLSNGQRQLVFLYFNLFLSPKLLILDESFTFLGQELTDQVRIDLIKAIREQGMAIIFVSHHHQILSPDNIYLIEDGIMKIKD